MSDGTPSSDSPRETSDPIRVRTLGGLRIVRGGAEQASLTAQPLRCALLLLVNVDERSTRDSVMGILWPDRDPERARHSLSQTLYELRKDQGEGCVEVEGEILRRGSRVTVDAVEFAKAVEGGLATEGLELYRGHFLEGVGLAPTREFEAWIDRTRQRLLRLHRKARSTGIQELVQEGRLRTALSSARDWVDLDSLDDEAQHHLIELLFETGSRTAALRQFDRYRELLRRELELEPLDQTVALIHRIRAAGEVTDPDVDAPDGESVAEAPDRVGSGSAPSSRPDPQPGREPGSGPASAPGASGSMEGQADGARERGPAIPRVLAFYVVASFGVLQLIDLLIERLALAESLFAVALILLLAGVPVVLGTAWAESGRPGHGSIRNGWLFSRVKALHRFFTWRNAALGGMAALAVLVVSALLLLPAQRLSPEAEVIAVLPFTTSGEEVEDFGRGIVSLLGPNLDGMGGIRSVDPRTVISRWDREAADSESDLEGALEVGRRLGAGSVVMGSVVALGDRVRLLAELRSSGGDRLARAEAEGPLSEVLSMVDSLTLDLVREVWRSREPLPDLRVRALTTGSLSAIRAFFAGEELYRRSRWDSAAVEFRRAADLDSTFALAHFRASESAFWGGRGLSPVVTESMDAAYRHRERLPPRERTLLAARRLDLEGDPAAIDTMTSYVGRYPQDGEGWFYLADVRFHGRALLAPSPEAIYRPFERAVELLPSFTPALIHPLEWSLMRNDSVRFHGYLERFRNRGEGGGEPFATWGRALWGPADSVPSYVRASLEDVPPQGWTAFLPAVLLAPDLDPEVLVDALRSRAPDPAPEDPVEQLAVERRLEVLGALGRLDELDESVEAFRGVDPAGADLVVVRAAIAGTVPRSFARRAITRLEGRADDPEAAYWLAVHALSGGDPDEAEGWIGEALREPGVPGSMLGARLAAARGWAEIARGDTTGGLNRLEEGLRESGWWNVGSAGALYHTWARTLAASPGTREEGIRRFRNNLPRLEYLAPRELELARSLRAAGDREGASAAYRRLQRLWAGADPDAGLFAVEARRGLRELEGAGP